MSLKEISSLSDILFRGVEYYPEKVAIGDASYELTYEELYVKTFLFAKELQKSHGVLSNNSIGILLPNSVEFVIAYFATQFLGAIAVPLDPDIKINNLDYCLKQANAKAIIIQKNTTDYKANLSNINSRKGLKIINFDYITELLNRPLSFLEIKDSLLFKSKINVNEIASYMYTTGSTGYPKGVVICQKNVIRAISNTVEFVNYSDSDSELISLPLSHNFGLVNMFCNLAVGGTSYLVDGISNFKLLFELLNKKQPSGFPGTPSGFKVLTKMFPNKIKECRSFLKFIIINSERCPPSLVKTLTTLLPETKIFIYYGLTEASRSTFIKFDVNTQDYYLNSVGKASQNVEISIISEGLVEKYEGHQLGRVAIKGAHVSKGYLGKNNLFNIHNDWFITDDIGYLDSDNYLFLTGRLSSFINKGGLKIDPKEIEDVLSSIDSIKDYAVIGLNDEISGQKICVCYVSDLSLDNAEKAIFKECSVRLETLKIPDLYVNCDSIPRNKTGKLLRKELEKNLRYNL
jgi:long-chain acyl-CoA synthetase